jgi:hypothetical protein
MNEVYYCGNCRRQQLPPEGKCCKVGGKLTVSWYTDKEGEQDALRRWKQWNGGAVNCLS